MAEGADGMIRAMREMHERHRLAMPWVQWARQNPVALVRTEWLEPGTAFVASNRTGIGSVVVVIAHPTIFNLIRQALDYRDASFPIADQELAEMIAWHQADLNEPGDSTDG